MPRRVLEEEEEEEEEEDEKAAGEVGCHQMDKEEEEGEDGIELVQMPTLDSHST